MECFKFHEVFMKLSLGTAKGLCGGSALTWEVEFILMTSLTRVM